MVKIHRASYGHRKLPGLQNTAVLLQSAGAVGWGREGTGTWPVVLSLARFIDQSVVKVLPIGLINYASAEVGVAAV